MFLEWLEEKGAERSSEWASEAIVIIQTDWPLLAAPAILAIFAAVTSGTVAGVVAIAGMALVALWAIGNASQKDTAVMLSTLFCLACVAAIAGGLRKAGTSSRKEQARLEAERQLEETRADLAREIRWRMAAMPHNEAGPREIDASESEPETAERTSAALSASPEARPPQHEATTKTDQSA